MTFGEIFGDKLFFSKTLRGRLPPFAGATASWAKLHWLNVEPTIEITNRVITNHQ